jgi:hypothetical protein
VERLAHPDLIVDGGLMHLPSPEVTMVGVTWSVVTIRDYS